MAPDKQAHLKWGAAGAVALTVLLFAALSLRPYMGGVCAVATVLCVAGPVVGWVVERYQAVRREGTPSLADALHTAAPFWLAAAALVAAQVLLTYAGGIHA